MIFTSWDCVGVEHPRLLYSVAMILLWARYGMKVTADWFCQREQAGGIFTANLKDHFVVKHCVVLVSDHFPLLFPSKSSRAGWNKSLAYDGGGAGLSVPLSKCTRTSICHIIRSRGLFRSSSTREHCRRFYVCTCQSTQMDRSITIMSIDLCVFSDHTLGKPIYRTSIIAPWGVLTRSMQYLVCKLKIVQSEWVE